MPTTVVMWNSSLLMGTPFAARQGVGGDQGLKKRLVSNLPSFD
jgi:hypothetical protein